MNESLKLFYCLDKATKRVLGSCIFYQNVINYKSTPSFSQKIFINLGDKTANEFKSIVRSLGAKVENPRIMTLFLHDIYLPRIANFQ